MPGEETNIGQDIDALINATLLGDYDDDAPWKAVKKLRALGSREVLERAIELTHSEDPLRRARGADILSQLGVAPGVHSTSFVPERLHALLSLLQSESHPPVLGSTISALGHLGKPEGTRAVLRFVGHPAEDVRYAVACALPSGLDDDPDVIAALLDLTRDSDSDVRDWATFGLGTQSNADSEIIRKAFVDRLQDLDEDTRAEAVVGLAKRQDLRSLPVIIEELERDEYGRLYEEAASYLLGLDDVTPEGWESWNYIEALKARYNIAREKADLLPQRTA